MLGSEPAVKLLPVTEVLMADMLVPITLLRPAAICWDGLAVLFQLAASPNKFTVHVEPATVGNAPVLHVVHVFPAGIVVPTVGEYVKLLACAEAVSTEAPAVAVPGCWSVEKLPKKNSLFLMTCPPTLPPNSFSSRCGLGVPVASFRQLFAFRYEFRKSSKARPWKSLPPRRVVKLICMLDCPKP